MPSLDELLLADGVCTPQQIEDAVRNQVILGGLLGTNLVELGHLDEKTLADYLGRQHNLPALSGGDIRPDSEALGRLPPETVDRLNIIPFAKQNERLQVLCINPQDLSALDEVALQTGLRPEPIVVPEVRFWQLLKDIYGIERQLRFVALDTRDFISSALAEQQPVVESTADGDPISEERFAQLYQRRDGFPQLKSPPPEPSAEQAPLVSIEDLEEIEQSVVPQPSTEPDRPTVSQWLDGHRPIGTDPRPEDEDSPLSLSDAEQLLDEVDDRDAIARVVLRYARSLFKRCMLLTVHRSVALGWDALGENIDSWSFRNLMIPLDKPSVFQIVVATRAHYLGALAKTPVNIKFLKATGKQVPLSALAMPVLVRGRAVNVLYADNGHKRHSPNDIGALLILAQRISRSYEHLCERRRRAFLQDKRLAKPRGWKMEDRRSFKRLPAEATVRVLPTAKSPAGTARGKDLSAGGICFVYHERLEPGSLADIEVIHPRRPSSTAALPPLRARIRVLRVDGEQPPFEVAAEFVEP